MYDVDKDVAIEEIESSKNTSDQCRENILSISHFLRLLKPFVDSSNNIHRGDDAW